jgi:hypothetical protein
VATGGSAGRLHERTGTPIHPMSPLAKLAWWRAHEPATFAATPYWGGVKELVVAALCDAPFLTDLSCASATGMYDVHERRWDPEALELAGVGLTQLAEVAPTTQVLPGGLRAAALLGHHALGAIEDLDDVPGLIAVDGGDAPDPAAVEAYTRAAGHRRRVPVTRPEDRALTGRRGASRPGRSPSAPAGASAYAGRAGFPARRLDAGVARSTPAGAPDGRPAQDRLQRGAPS